MQVKVHQDQCLLHTLDIGARLVDQGFAMADQSPEGRGLGSGAKTCPEKSKSMKLLNPLTINDVGLAPGNPFDGMRMQGKVLETYVSGTCIYKAS